MDFFDNIKNITENIKKDEPMSKHSTFRIGGKADYFVEPESFDKIKEIISLCRDTNTKYTILGNGSNVLVSDDGIEGVVISIGNKLSGVSVNDNQIYAEAGAMLSVVSKFAYENSLTGLEFASGIPGTLGGAIVMNAGAYGGEMKDVTDSVGVLGENGEVTEISNADAGFGYRKSIFCDYVVLYAKLHLDYGNKEDISAKMLELNEKRKAKQPLQYPSAGSTFKRPEGYFAGKLIEDAGLKGFSIGGAKVSEKHSGFVINAGNATADDVKRLISEVQKRVFEQFGVSLEREVKYIGR